MFRFDQNLWSARIKSRIDSKFLFIVLPIALSMLWLVFFASETVKDEYIFFPMALMIVVVMYNFRKTEKTNIIITTQKLELERQNSIIESKQKEILDSIEYALRIQTAILPSLKLVKQYLENSFIFYRPKDIVAGDFYWVEKVDGVVFFAACDCTGHGVPGAMVSVVCHNALSKAVHEFGLRQPSKILDKTTEIVLEKFSKSEEEIYDGMDISLCAFDPTAKTLEWAGANNSLFIVHNGLLVETKPDKQCIGYNHDLRPFTNHHFYLESKTSIYIFTDGYSDQFGGVPERKLTRNRFKDLLLSLQDHPMEEQSKDLEMFIADFRSEIEQTDDILVMGVFVE